MFDPLTVAFEIKSRFWHKSSFDGSAVREVWVRIWHKDPCSDGTDSSCYHRIQYRQLNAQEKKLAQYIYDGEVIFDNRPHYPDSREHYWYARLKLLKNEWRARRTPAIPWRWHVWHWRIQVPVLQRIYRAWFARCTICHRGFKYGEEVLSNWEGTSIWHFECDQKLRPPNT